LAGWANAAQQSRSTFPQSLFIKIVRAIFSALAKWLVKNALRDAASELGIMLTSRELDVLTDLAVGFA
jgi:hypothetical protein